MKRKYRIGLLGAFALCLIGPGPMACRGIHRGVTTTQDTVRTEKQGPAKRLPSAAVALKVHHEAAGLACEDCHGSGKPQAIGTDTCLGCHGTAAEVAQATANMEPNPHDSVHYGPDVACDLCHHEHATSENYCNTCHEFDGTVP